MLPAFKSLVRGLRVLPGVGERTATKMAADILALPSSKSYALVESIQSAVDRIGFCRECGGFAESELCPICSDDQRDRARICVVQNPLEVWQLEATGQFRGRFLVLGGVLSPIDQIGPEDLRIDTLQRWLEERHIEEVLFALPATAEAEATVHFIRSMIRSPNVAFTSLAYGIPVGGSLEYLDNRTIEFALNHRRSLDEG